jgi:TrmH family RNA methyltransferase
VTPPSAGINHPRVKQYLSAKRRGSSHLIALEGLWAIRAAATAGIPIEVLFVCPPLLRGAEVERVVDREATLVLEVSERVLRRLVDREGPDGLAAIAHVRPRRLEDLAIGACSTVVVADALDLAGNLGTLLRCADGAGAAAVVVTDRRVRLNHPLVVKASMGTVFTMPVVAADRDEALVWLRAHGVRTIAADPGAPTSYRVASYGCRTAVVVGSERHGLHPFWRAHADQLVSIPMLGSADSLNVAHAAVLLLYEVLHQRR